MNIPYGVLYSGKRKKSTIFVDLFRERLIGRSEVGPEAVRRPRGGRRGDGSGASAAVSANGPAGAHSGPPWGSRRAAMATPFGGRRGRLRETGGTCGALHAP